MEQSVPIQTGFDKFLFSYKIILIMDMSTAGKEKEKEKG